MHSIYASMLSAELARHTPELASQPEKTAVLVALEPPYMSLLYPGPCRHKNHTGLGGSVQGQCCLSQTVCERGAGCVNQLLPSALESKECPLTECASPVHQPPAIPVAATHCATGVSDRPVLEAGRFPGWKKEQKALRKGALS